MHIHIEVNTIQAEYENKKEKKERERERERGEKGDEKGETVERKIVIVVVHIGVFIYASETSYIYTD